MDAPNISHRNRVQAIVNIGAVHHSSGEHPEAIEYYQWALREDPTYASAMSNYGALLFLK